MSALDQAFIRAYAKETAAAPSPRAVAPSPYCDAVTPPAEAPVTPAFENVPRVAWRIDDPGWGPATPLPTPAPHWMPAYQNTSNPFLSPYGSSHPRDFGGYGHSPQPQSSWLPPVASPSELGYATEPPAPMRRFDAPQKPAAISPHFVLVTSADNDGADPLPETIAALDLPTSPLFATNNFDPALLPEQNEVREEAEETFETNIAAESPCELIGEPTPARDKTAAIHAIPTTEYRPSVTLELRSDHEPPPAIEELLDDEEPLPTGPFRPRWEVDGFEWPAICDRLLAERGDELEHLVYKLTAKRGAQAAIVGLAGCMRGDGKSTVAMCLAHAAASSGLRVALVDADFDHPDLGERLQVDVREGWEAAINGTTTLAEVTVTAADLRLNLLPLAGTLDASPAEIALGLADTLELLAEHHDLVVVDLGTLPAGEAVLPAPPEMASSMQALIVRDGRAASPARLAAACSHLRSAGLEVVGVVDNFQLDGDARSSKQQAASGK